MEPTKKARKQNRTQNERRDELNRKIAYHENQANQLKQKLVDLGKPRKPRALSMNKALAEVKAAGITPEELMKILSERKEAETT